MKALKESPLTQYLVDLIAAKDVLFDKASGKSETPGDILLPCKESFQLALQELRDDVASKAERELLVNSLDLLNRASMAAEAISQGEGGEDFGDVFCELLSGISRLLPLTKPDKKTDKTDSKTDKQKNSEKKLPSPEVNNCARYIREQQKLIKDGKRPKAAKKALIAEHLESDDTAAMEKNLSPSRYGWLLEIGQKTDK